MCLATDCKLLVLATRLVEKYTLHLAEYNQQEIAYFIEQTEWRTCYLITLFKTKLWIGDIISDKGDSDSRMI